MLKNRANSDSNQQSLQFIFFYANKSHEMRRLFFNSFLFMIFLSLRSTRIKRTHMLKTYPINLATEAGQRRLNLIILGLFLTSVE